MTQAGTTSMLGVSLEVGTQACAQIAGAADAAVGSCSPQLRGEGYGVRGDGRTAGPAALPARARGRPPDGRVCGREPCALRLFEDTTPVRDVYLELSTACRTILNRCTRK